MCGKARDWKILFLGRASWDLAFSTVTVCSMVIVLQVSYYHSFAIMLDFNALKEYPIGARVVIRNVLKSPELNGCVAIVNSQLKLGDSGRQVIVLADQAATWIIHKAC